jgi:hypothetical protein
MAKCKNCGGKIEWGQVQERWVPLEPLAHSEGLDVRFDYVDSDGHFRCDHRLLCDEQNPPVAVTRLDVPIYPNAGGQG